jgi:hypothetical protein
MQLEETMVGTAAEKAALVQDYLAAYSDEVFASALDQIGRLAHQDLLDFGRLAELLGYDRKLNTLDYPVIPRGYRVLGRIPRLPKLVVAEIVKELGGLTSRCWARPTADLEAVEEWGDSREGHPRGPAPPAGDQPRGPLSADLDKAASLAGPNEGGQHSPSNRSGAGRGSRGHHRGQCIEFEARRPCGLSPPRRRQVLRRRRWR